MMQSPWRVAVILLIAAVCAGALYSESQAGEQPRVVPLRVGITPNYPPMIFKLGVEITGLEADLARLLGKELGRPVQFIEVRWDDQIPALLERKTDIIMSGMTITDARKVRIDFTDHYLKSGLLIATRAGDAAKYSSLKNVMESFPSVGVIKGTTAETYVRRNFPKATKIVLVPNAEDGAYELKSRRIDVLVHDAPSIIWLISENETELKGLWEILSQEYLGWGVRRDDEEFTKQVNTALKKWKEEGTLKKVILRWLPYWKNFE